MERQCGLGEDTSPLNLFPHLSNAVTVQVLPSMWNKCQPFSAHHPLRGRALLLLARVAWAAHGRCQTGTDLFWLADLCWPKESGGWGTGPGSTSTLVRRSLRWLKELGLRSHQACVRISALIVSSCEILGKSPKTLRSLRFLGKMEMPTLGC